MGAAMTTGRSRAPGGQFSHYGLGSVHGGGTLGGYFWPGCIRMPLSADSKDRWQSNQLNSSKSRLTPCGVLWQGQSCSGRSGIMPVRQKARGKEASTTRCGLRQVKSEGCQFNNRTQRQKGHFRPIGSSYSSTKPWKCLCLRNNSRTKCAFPCTL